MTHKNKIILDLDGVLCEIDVEKEYIDRKVNNKVVKATKNAIGEGFDVTIFSARNMRTYEGNIDKINKHTRPIIESWLKKNKVIHQDLVLGKVWNGPKGFYVDDNNLHPEEYEFRFSGPLQKYDFDVVVPFYNEEGNIENVYKNILKSKRLLRINKIIMIDNGSIDGSRQILRKLSKQNEDICIVEIDKNKGYGHGIKQGMKLSNADYVITVHGDNQFRLYEYLLCNMDNITKNYSDKCSILSIRSGRRFREYFITFQLFLILSCIFFHKVNEFNGQPKIIPREILKNIDLLPNDFTIDLNIWYLCRQSGNKIMFLKTNQFERDYGRSSWGGFSSLMLLFSYIRRAFILKYVN